MGQVAEAFIGIDVAKARNAIAIADGKRGGEVRYLGEVEASATSAYLYENVNHIPEWRLMAPSGRTAPGRRCPLSKMNRTIDRRT